MAGSVQKRRVFYIPGFDPVPARKYRELYRVESANQAKISGYKITQHANPLSSGFGWATTAVIDGQTTETTFEVLEWADIVKSTMSSGVWATYLSLFRTAWIYISSGALFDILRLRKGPVIAALYPVGLLVLQLLIALSAAYFIGTLASIIHPLASLLGLVVIYPILKFFKALDGKLYAYYLMQDYAHAACHWGEYTPELSQRLDDFTGRIAATVEEEWDEILIVGHSSGAHLATSVISRLTKAGYPIEKMSFLTLGQVFPMVSFLPKAHELRQDMRDVSSSDIFWLDVSAPGDGCTFALCDPVRVNAIEAPNQKGPLILSAAFSQTLKPETWKALRWRFFRLHFQYLHAFDNPSLYDYFSITAGPKTLAERFHDQRPSASKITTPTARYSEVAR